MPGKSRQRVIDIIQSKISSGMYAPGSRLPTELELAATFQVARGTVRSALKELAENGVIELRKGVGCFVSPGQYEPRMIALLTSKNDTGYGTEQVISGVVARAAESGIGVAIFYFDDDPAQFADLLQRIRSLHIKRVLFRPIVVPDFEKRNGCFVKQLNASKLHYVTLGAPLVFDGELAHRYVAADNYSTMRKLVGALTDKGFRRFGLLRSFPGVYSSDLRYQAFVDELTGRGIPIGDNDIKITLDVPIHEQGRVRVHEWLKEGLPEIIVCNHDVLAYNVLDELQQHNIRVPEDVAVSGFDDLPGSAAFGLTTVRQNFSEFGRRTTELLLDEAAQNVWHEDICGELIFRRSTER